MAATAALRKGPKSGKLAKVSRKKDVSHPRTQKVLLNKFTFAMAEEIAKKRGEPMTQVLERMVALAEALDKDD